MTTQAITDTSPLVQLNMLLHAAVKTANDNAVAHGKLEAGRTSVNDNIIAVGTQAGSEEAFVRCCDNVFAALRSNWDGCAVVAGCAEADKVDKDGNIVYLIPPAIMSAKSTVRAALAAGSKLVDSEGQPAKMHALRKENKAAKAAATEQAVTPEDKVSCAALDANIELLAQVRAKIVEALGDLDTQAKIDTILVDTLLKITAINAKVDPFAGNDTTRVDPYTSCPEDDQLEAEGELELAADMAAEREAAIAEHVTDGDAASEG